MLFVCAWTDWVIPSRLLRTQTSWLHGHSVAWKGFSTDNICSPKRADPVCEAGLNSIHQSWKCLSLMKLLERWRGHTKITRRRFVCFPASAELFLVFINYPWPLFSQMKLIQWGSFGPWQCLTLHPSAFISEAAGHLWLVYGPCQDRLLTADSLNIEGEGGMGWAKSERWSGSGAFG